MIEFILIVIGANIGGVFVWIYYALKDMDDQYNPRR